MTQAIRDTKPLRRCGHVGEPRATETDRNVNCIGKFRTEGMNGRKRRKVPDKAPAVPLVGSLGASWRSARTARQPSRPRVPMWLIWPLRQHSS